MFTSDKYPPWFEHKRRDLERDNCTYIQPLQPANRLTRQRPGRYDESRLKNTNYVIDPVTLLPMGKDLVQKTRIAFCVDSTMKSSYNTNSTLWDVRVMNMPCTSLSEIAEVTDKIFTPAVAETIPLSSVLVYSNAIDHLALQGTLKYFEPRHVRFTEGFVTGEVTAYVETMTNIARTMKNKTSSFGAIFVSPLAYMYLLRPLQQFLYLVLEAAYEKDLRFYIVAPNLKVRATTWRSCEASYPALLAEVSKTLQAYTG